jgi:hypothetical protein
MENQEWSLESFVDSLVVELDKTRETLAVKSINRPLTYTVKDMSLELQIFPTYDGDDVRFQTARPGQQGASKISLQLASITDQQVRATSKAPPKRDDIKLDAVEIDPNTKRKLRRLGVTSVGDLEQIEKRDVDLEKVGEGVVNYKSLANLIQKSRRNGLPPRVNKVSLNTSTGTPVLELEGENLSVSGRHTPVAVVNDELGEVVEHGPERVAVQLRGSAALRAVNDVILTLDPYCIVRLRVNNPGERPGPTPVTL